MAITITKPGKSPNDRVYHAVCKGCNCEYDYLYSDTVIDNSDGDNRSWRGTRCPTCGKGISHHECVHVS